MSPTFFRTVADFRAWLEKHHASEQELWVGYYKVSTGKQSITYPESRDEALCFGWIDGLKKSIDEASYMQRFTPRRSDSYWSKVNMERVAVLLEEGRMAPAGVEAYEARDPEKSGRYSFELERAELSTAQKKRFEENPEAWAFWRAQPAGYRKQATWWVVSAKRESTRERRLETLIADSAGGLRIKQYR